MKYAAQRQVRPRGSLPPLGQGCEGRWWLSCGSGSRPPGRSQNRVGLQAGAGGREEAQPRLETLPEAEGNGFYGILPPCLVGVSQDPGLRDGLGVCVLGLRAQRQTQEGAAHVRRELSCPSKPPPLAWQWLSLLQGPRNYVSLNVPFFLSFFFNCHDWNNPSLSSLSPLTVNLI